MYFFLWLSFLWLSRVAKHLALATLLTSIGIGTATAQQPQRMGLPPANVSFPSGQDVVEVNFEVKMDKIIIPVSIEGSAPLRFIRLNHPILGFGPRPESDGEHNRRFLINRGGIFERTNT